MTVDEIKANALYGDYNILGTILGVTPSAARGRFLRGDKRAMDIMMKISENREQFIKSFNSK